MGSTNARSAAIAALTSFKSVAPRVSFQDTPLKDLFASNVFNEEAQRERLPKPVFKALQKTIKKGAAARSGDRRRRRHRHEGLGHRTRRHALHALVPADDRPHRREARLLPRPHRRRQGHRRVLRQGTGRRASPTPPPSPPAASAPPSKPAATPPGIPPARPSSSKTPTAPRWSSRPPSSRWTGEALDKKTPLLRSMEALSNQALRILRLFGNTDATKVFTTVGPEQEYFLIDKQLLLRPPRPDQRRPDALRRQAAQGPGAGRPVLRRDPRARAGLHGRGRARALQARRAGQDPPQRSRPGPVRARPDLRERQPRHRSPDADDGNAAQAPPTSTAWSACCTRSPSPASTARASTTTGRMATDAGENLLNPGDTPHDNAQFLVFCCAVIRAVAKYAGLLRVAVAGAGNDHRLGANEAPPAIISIFLGDQLTDIIEQIEKGGAKSDQAGRPRSRPASQRAAEAAAGRRRPQPHQPVRLHRQQVRVPRRRLLASRSPARTPSSTRSSPSRSTTSPTEAGEGRSRPARTSTSRHPGAAPEDHQGAQARHLQRRQLHRGVARGSREARPAEPQEHRRLPARLIIDKECIDAVRQVQGATASAKLHSRYEIFLESYIKTINIEGQLTADAWPRR